MHAWLEVASRGSTAFAPATFARAAAHAAAGRAPLAWRLLDVARAQDPYADLPVLAGKAAVLGGVVGQAALAGGLPGLLQGAAALLAECAEPASEPGWESEGSFWEGLLDLARGGLYLPPLLPPRSPRSSSGAEAALPPSPMNRTSLIAAITALQVAAQGDRGRDRTYDSSLAAAIYSSDVNGDGVVDESDWEVGLRAALRARAREREERLGARHVIGGLPLSGSDRRLCGVAARTWLRLGAALQVLLLAAAARVAVGRLWQGLQG
jgi:hypothetical protein